VLTDARATRAEIAAGLDWLRQVATPSDLVVVLLSGTGLVDQEHSEYFFAPYDVDPANLKGTSVGWDTLRATLEKLPAKVLLAVDTCHAGALGTGAVGSRRYTDLLSDAREAGLVTFASCQPMENSRESDLWQNGAFTKALIEALDGQADVSHNGVVTLTDAASYVARRVRELTQDRQHPALAFPSFFPLDFPLTVVK
jgi:uncharacterized caspase-like protein